MEEAKTVTPHAAPKRRRKWLFWSSIVFASLLILLLFVPSLLSTNWGKSWIESIASEKSGYQIQMEDLSLGWWSGAAIAKLQVQGSAELKRFEADSLRLNGTLWAWVFGKRNLDLQIDRPFIQYFSQAVNKTEPAPEKEKEISTRSESTSAPKPEEKFEWPLDSLHLLVKDGRVEMEGEGVGGKTTLDSLQMELQSSSRNQPLQFQISGNLQNDTAPAKISSRGNLDLHSLSGELVAKLDRMELAPWFALFRPFLEKKIDKLEGALQASIVLKAQSLNAVQVEGSLDLLGIRLSGPGLQEGLSLDGSLKLNSEGNLSSNRIRFSLPQIVYGDTRLEQGAGLLELGTARADLREFQVMVNGRPLRAHGSFDGAGAKPIFQLEADCDALPMQQKFLSVLAYPIPFLASSDSHLLQVQTELSGKFSLKGEGKNWPELKESLTAEGNLSFGAGFFTGPSALSKILGEKKQSLRFDALDAPFSLQSGKIQTPGILLKLADTKITMKGSTTLDGVLDYRVELDLPPSMKEKKWGAALESMFGKQGLPVSLGGTVKNPQPVYQLPELKESVKPLIEKAAEEELNKALERLQKKKKKD